MQSDTDSTLNTLLSLLCSYVYVHMQWELANTNRIPWQAYLLKIKARIYMLLGGSLCFSFFPPSSLPPFFPCLPHSVLPSLYSFFLNFCIAQSCPFSLKTLPMSINSLRSSILTLKNSSTQILLFPEYHITIMHM